MFACCPGASSGFHTQKPLPLWTQAREEPGLLLPFSISSDCSVHRLPSQVLASHLGEEGAPLLSTRILKHRCRQATSPHGPVPGKNRLYFSLRGL